MASSIDMPRVAKRFRYNENDSTDSGTDSDDYKGRGSSSPVEMHQGARNRQPKSFSRNALMARENRLRKKIYIENIERDLAKEKNRSRKLNERVKEQTGVIERQEREIKYMKNVLANSKDIGMLLKSIHSNTGMCVGSSLDKKLSIKDELKDHPWYESPTDFNSISFSDDNEASIETQPLDEHSYTLTDPEDDVGVCLHVSKHKVALEFCSGCNENAQAAWRRDL